MKDDFVFEAPSPGSWDRTRTGFALANEEAAHATLCLYFDIPVQEIRIDNPIDDADNVGGWVRTIPDTSSTEALEGYVKVTLAGPLATGREIPWPPSRDDSADEAILARLTYILGYDETRWNSAVFFVKEFLKFPTTQHTMKLIGSALLE
jgi:hypothetical protein